MDKIRLLQSIIYIVSTGSILLGTDLLLGAKITSRLNKVLNRTVLSIDEMISKDLSAFNKAVDVYIDIDEKIIKTKAKRIVGLLFIVIGAGLIFLAWKS